MTMKARLAMKSIFSALCADGSSGILYVPNFCKIAETIGEDIRVACT